MSVGRGGGGGDGGAEEATWKVVKSNTAQLGEI